MLAGCRRRGGGGDVSGWLFYVLREEEVEFMWTKIETLFLALEYIIRFYRKWLGNPPWWRSSTSALIRNVASPVSMNVQLIEEYCINHEGLFCVNPLK